MSPLSIAPSSRTLTRDGKPFFYLADTVWSAFTNPTEEEWEQYLGFRRRQGFNALQINIMPQGDRSDNTWANPFPFARDEKGHYDFNRPNEAYFERAARMTATAVKHGFTPALILLWGDLVPGTWINTTFKTHPMPLEKVGEYVERVVRYFAEYNPIWMVSGDTNLPDCVLPWYKAALDRLRELTPRHLCMFHHGAAEPLPDEWPDIYLMYSGHGGDTQAGAYKQAEERWAKAIKRPIINGEPCYEALRHAGSTARFSAFEVRRALWWALLSGCMGGTAYGAHGVWNWHRKGVPFCAENFWGTPLDWREALRLPGALDACHLKSLVEREELATLSPAQELLKEGTPETIRAAANASRSRLAIYVPYTQNVSIKLDLSSHKVRIHNLTDKSETLSELSTGKDESTIGMLQQNTDYLITASL